MSFDSHVLRAMLRLARRRQTASDEQVALRVGADRAAVRSALRRLAANGWVEIGPDAARLTLQGLAVAVALLPGTAASRGNPRAGASARTSNAA